MALFKLSHLKFLHRQPTQPKVVLTPSSTGQAITPPISSPPQPKSLTEIERELEEEQRLRIQFTHPVKNASQQSPLKKIVIIALLCGIPIGVIWLVNLPYAVIRRPVAEVAPILLLPSYISLDHNYRIAITTLEQAEQLINNATAPTDLDLGEQKLREVQRSLDKLPVGWLSDSFYSNYSGYNWRFSTSNFNAARAKAGRLKGQLFQEKNAQTMLFEAEQTLATARQKYPQAQTATDRQTAIAQWQTALDQLEQIPGETLAGKSAQQKLAAYHRDFQEIVGLAAGNQHTLMLFSTAREYSQRAAIQGQNPPHTAEEWQQIAKVWEEAIAQVERVSEDDTGYAEAQKMRAEYLKNLGQITIRLQAEEQSVRIFEQVQQEKVELFAIVATPTNRASIMSRLQSIIDQLEQVQNGTRVYSEAQILLASAQNKLNQFEP
ncbi:MAG: hypothetical protein KME11_15750 [Timaviella obliquedivisa GSE-PSE-MK23-08B]|jgi:hypothetical protein|nr:hypothetical protein [Timaviella obliquedivisa GSE-PSE-MK23-08B]